MSCTLSLSPGSVNNNTTILLLHNKITTDLSSRSCTTFTLLLLPVSSEMLPLHHEPEILTPEGATKAYFVIQQRQLPKKKTCWYSSSLLEPIWDAEISELSKMLFHLVPCFVPVFLLDNRGGVVSLVLHICKQLWLSWEGADTIKNK